MYPITLAAEETEHHDHQTSPSGIGRRSVAGASFLGQKETAPLLSGARRPFRSFAAIGFPACSATGSYWSLATQAKNNTSKSCLETTSAKDQSWTAQQLRANFGQGLLAPFNVTLPALGSISSGRRVDLSASNRKEASEMTNECSTALPSFSIESMARAQHPRLKNWIINEQTASTNRQCRRGR